MERKMLRKNLNSPTKKKNKNLQQKLDSIDAPKLSVESEVLNWDGILAAMTFAVPFVVGIAINLQAAIAITTALAVVLVPVSLLAYCMRQKLTLPPWITAPVCALASAGITAMVAVYLRSNYPQINDALGMYLYLLSAYPIVSAVFYGKRARSIGNTLAWAVRNIIYFGIFTCLAGIVRELLAYNRFAGIELGTNLKMEAAKMPFFGFITFAFILAGVAATYRAVSGRMMATGTDTDEEYSRIELEGATQVIKTLESNVQPVVAEPKEDNNVL